VSRAPIVNLAGFGLTTGLLALASIATIPAMVSASGPGSWGAIALGQGVGGIAALVVGYGWTVTGPPKIAQSSFGEQFNEYADAMRVKLALFLPCAAIAALVATVISPGYPLFTAAGAISATAVAFSAGWFFAGLSRPFLLLGLETVPRVVSTGIGVVLMHSGWSALTGLACMTAGMIAAFAIVTVWVFRTYGRGGAQRIPTPTSELLRSRREGIAVMLGAQLFFSAPLAIVSVAAPAQQPMYALADKIRQLVSAGLSPLVMVFQGWVPQRGSDVIRKRATIALGYAAVLGLVVIVVFLAVGDRLMQWLGHGEIPSDRPIIVLTALTVAVDLFNSVLVFAVIAALGPLRIVTRATAISVVVMLVVTTVGALRFGPAGALAGLLTGLIARVALELRALRDSG